MKIQLGLFEAALLKLILKTEYYYEFRVVLKHFFHILLAFACYHFCGVFQESLLVEVVSTSLS